MTRQFHELVTGLGWAYPRTFANQASTAATEDDTRLIVDELPGTADGRGRGRPTPPQRSRAVSAMPSQLLMSEAAGR